MAIAKIKYFADMADGTVRQFDKVDNYAPGKFRGWVGGREWVEITRRVQYKAFASKHECDARCMNASGRTMNCECSCGGKNHGRGGFACEAA